MNTLKKELIKLSKAHPELTYHIDEVIKGASISKTAKKVEDTVVDNNILGLDMNVARTINDVFRKHKLDPYLTSVTIKPMDLIVMINVNYNGIEYESNEMQRISEEIVNRVKVTGFTRLEGDGFKSNATGRGVIRLTQKH